MLQHLGKAFFLYGSLALALLPATLSASPVDKPADAKKAPSEIVIPANNSPAVRPTAPTAASPGVQIYLPARGMTMKAVEKEFGPPIKKRPAVGKPPITRWNYQAFTVYFEDHYVINAVINPR